MQSHLVFSVFNKIVLDFALERIFFENFVETLQFGSHPI